METASTPVRGRPREFDPEKALAAALEIFWRRGYEGASLAELTEAMGITKPSLYACFGNKESLFRKALDLYERDKLCYVKSALEAPTAKQVAERLLKGALAMQCGNTDPKGCMGVISSVANTAHAECIRNEILARRASSDRALIERFERAQKEGDLPADVEPKALALYLTTMLQGLAVQAGSGVPEDRLTQLVDTALTMWPSA
ncbi:MULTISPECIES: TetR/AcrR family transcriptional regulator [Sphingobium]|uniref:TetR/AcrR family transcriptional regulator n=1 Tax=Sphingobium tyrosinilyticum TaxID=2715436 RepID=A0ABV9EZ93_9SPHN|nr:TetR/AcrR family transcriptional regulator [Sphingobium sp. EP60837]ANI79976.1 HTH-type transcriptional repressor ComR [Sphingobium sp. EP60837]